MKNNPKVVIGFTGLIACGKGIAVKYVSEKYDFIPVSNSDQIREEILKRGLEINRVTLATVAGDLRDNFGSGILAKRAWDKIKKQSPERVVFDAVRTLGEVEFLKSLPNFYLIAIESDIKIRFQRVIDRVKKEGRNDSKTWEEFLKTEKRDTGYGMNVPACMKLADFKITNEGTEEKLYQQLDDIINSKSVRPYTK